MLSLDLTAPRAAQSNNKALTPCNTMVVQGFNASSLHKQWQQETHQKLLWVHQGLLKVEYTQGKVLDLSPGMYVVLESNSEYRISGSVDVQAICLSHTHASSVSAAAPESASPAPRSGDLVNDLSFAPLVINDHVIQLLKSTVLATEEGCLDSDKTFFILQGSLTVADEMGEETLHSNEVVSIKANTYHRIYANENTTAITIQRSNARVKYVSAPLAGLN